MLMGIQCYRELLLWVGVKGGYYVRLIVREYLSDTLPLLNTLENTLGSP